MRRPFEAGTQKETQQDHRNLTSMSAAAAEARRRCLGNTNSKQAGPSQIKPLDHNATRPPRVTHREAEARRCCLSHCGEIPHSACRPSKRDIYWIKDPHVHAGIRPKAVFRLAFRFRGEKSNVQANKTTNAPTQHSSHGSGSSTSNTSSSLVESSILKRPRKQR
jgi:hypothetical protein